MNTFDQSGPETNPILLMYANCQQARISQSSRLLPFEDTNDDLTAVYGRLQRFSTMRFGKTIHRLRQAKGFTLRVLAEQVGVSYAYISKVERNKLVFGEFPSESLIRKLALALDADEERLLLLASKIPDSIRRRVVERPDAFRKIAQLSDQKLDQLLDNIDSD